MIETKKQSKALKTEANYGFVASKINQKILEIILRKRISIERINDLRSPVGFDIKAKLASEVAISILAEIINNYRTDLNYIPAAGKKQNKSCCDSK